MCSLLFHSTGLYPPKILSILSLPFTFITVTVFAFLLHNFQNDSRLNPSLLPRRSNLNSYGLFLILYVAVFLSIHDAISAACSSLITVENGSVDLDGNSDFKIIRGGRIVEVIP